MNMYQYELTLKAGADVLSVLAVSGHFRYIDGKATATVYATAREEQEKAGASSFRVLPVNPVQLALHCATAAARAAANRGGKAAEVSAAIDSDSRKSAEEKAARAAGKKSRAARALDTQETIYSDLRRVSAALAAALAGADIDLTEYVFSAIAATSSHTQDFFSVAILAATETAGTATEKAAAIFRALNKYTRDSQTAREKEVSTEYIIDGGGDIVSFAGAAAAIIRGGDSWTPAAGADIDSQTAAALSAALSGAAALLSPVQRKIWLYTVKGYSQSQTAAACGYAAATGKRTVQRHLDAIRATVAEYIEKAAPDCARFVKAAEVATAAAAAKKDRHSAEYMREYMRARRAAKKAAAAATV